MNYVADNGRYNRRPKTMRKDERKKAEEEKRIQMKKYC